jgi:hypothetical protein
MEDSLKLFALGTVLGGAALLAWQLRPKEGFGAAKSSSGPGPGLAALAASLTPEQKQAVKAARASGMSAVEALQSAGISPAALAAAVAR